MDDDDDNDSNGDGDCYDHKWHTNKSKNWAVWTTTDIQNECPFRPEKSKWTQKNQTLNGNTSKITD